MAPRKPSALRPAAAPQVRRSARIRDRPAVKTTAVTACSTTTSQGCAVCKANSRVSKPKAKPKAKKTPRKETCTTCDGSLALPAFPIAITEGCQHPISTCKGCLKTWIGMQMEMTTYDKISCPECPQLLTKAEVKKFASTEVFSRFDDLETRAANERIPGWRWCFNLRCGNGQVHVPLAQSSTGKSGKSKGKGKQKKRNEDDICQCEYCGRRACVPCDRPYHDGETCAEIQKRLRYTDEEKEEATLKTIGKVCKPCPGCKKNIQKNGGCDSVVCSQCRTQFCFLCNTKYKVINKTGHAKGCIYARPDRVDPHAAPPQIPQQANPGNGGIPPGAARFNRVVLANGREQALGNNEANNAAHDGANNGVNNAANNIANDEAPLVFNAWAQPYRPERHGPRPNNGARNGGFHIANGVAGNGGAAAEGAAYLQINNGPGAQPNVGNRVLRNGEYAFNAQGVRNEDNGGNREDDGARNGRRNGRPLYRYRMMAADEVRAAGDGVGNDAAANGIDNGIVNRQFGPHLPPQLPGVDLAGFRLNGARGMLFGGQVNNGAGHGAPPVEANVPRNGRRRPLGPQDAPRGHGPSDDGLEDVPPLIFSDDEDDDLFMF